MKRPEINQALREAAAIWHKNPKTIMQAPITRDKPAAINPREALIKSTYADCRPNYLSGKAKKRGNPDGFQVKSTQSRRNKDALRRRLAIFSNKD